MKKKLGDAAILIAIAGIMVFGVTQDAQLSKYVRIFFTQGYSAAVAEYRSDHQPDEALTIEQINDQGAKELLSLINALRKKHGLAALKLDVKLNEVARYRADLVKKAGRIQHDIPGEGLPSATLKRWKVPYSVYAENLATDYTDDRSVATTRKVHYELVASPGHFANMLVPEIRKLGVGISVGDGLRYLCEVFTGP